MENNGKKCNIHKTFIFTVLVLTVLLVLTMMYFQNYRRDCYGCAIPQATDEFNAVLGGHGKSNTERKGHPDLASSQQEVRHFGFLKVHKAGSSTVQNILYRFGLARNLSFVLPIKNHYLSKTKYKYNSILSPLSNVTGKYDILCNHCRFNLAKFKELLHQDAVYFAIVRDPLDLFLSAAYYYKFVWKFTYLKAMNNITFVSDLIREPKIYEPKVLAQSQTFNPMAHDFGYEFKSIEHVLNLTDDEMVDFAYNVCCSFKFVMVMERFDESLILLKRILKWELQDVLFIRQNTYISNKLVPKRKTINEEEKDVFKLRSRFDYILYDLFLRNFEDQIRKEVNISDEVKHFRTLLGTTQIFCRSKRGKRSSLRILKSSWNSEFSITSRDCELMKMNELKMFGVMNKRHAELLQNVRH